MERRIDKNKTILIILTMTMVLYISLVSNKNIMTHIDRKTVQAKEINETKKLNNAEKFIKEKKEIYNKQITMNVAEYMNEKQSENIDFEIGPETKAMLDGDENEASNKSCSSIPLSRGGSVGSPVTDRKSVV